MGCLICHGACAPDMELCEGHLRLWRASVARMRYLYIAQALGHARPERDPSGLMIQWGNAKPITDAEAMRRLNMYGGEVVNAAAGAVAAWEDFVNHENMVRTWGDAC